MGASCRRNTSETNGTHSYRAVEVGCYPYTLRRPSMQPPALAAASPQRCGKGN
jgi:hypothetical protein